MSERFSLTSHCHHFLASRTYPEGVFVDMTLGKGKDLAFLAQLAQGRLDLLMGIDVQELALEQSRQYMKSKMFIGDEESIQWRLGSHEHIDQWLKEWPKAQGGVSLALYNLGYLPGSDKQVTTQGVSTIKSLEGLMPWILPGGGISLMVYPGHDSGFRESCEIDQWLLNSLESEKWHLWQMRRLGVCHAPYWVWMQKLAHN